MEDARRLEALQSLETALSEHFPLTGDRTSGSSRSRRSQCPLQNSRSRGGELEAELQDEAGAALEAKAKEHGLRPLFLGCP